MYKKSFYYFVLNTLTFFIFLAFSVEAQIPNAGFENWTNGNPDNWSTSNNSQFSNVTQSADAHSGSYSVKGAVATISTFNITPALLARFAYTSRPSSLTGYYKFTSSSSDTLVVAVVLYKNSNGIGGGIFRTATSVSSYTQFTASIVYDSTIAPDSAAISISISPAENLHSGSEYYIDDLSFSGVTAVDANTIITAKNFKLEQNYPNPFNPTTIINYSIPRATFVTLNVYNVLGEKVKTLVSENKPAGNYSVNFNASELSSGIYFYRIKAGDFSQTKKLILMK
jgi:hypothetical protein